MDRAAAEVLGSRQRLRAPLQHDPARCRAALATHRHHARGSLALWWLPASWYETRSFERSGRIYERLGVRLFRRLVPNGDWVNAWRRRYDATFRVLRGYESALEFRRRTVIGEKGHLVLLAFGFGTALVALLIGWRGWAAYLAVTNILANLYPVLLQRYTRARISRLATRAAKIHP